MQRRLPISYCQTRDMKLDKTTQNTNKQKTHKKTLVGGLFTMHTSLSPLFLGTLSFWQLKCGFVNDKPSSWKNGILMQQDHTHGNAAHWWTGGRTDQLGCLLTW